jgi:plastocyanin
LREWQPLESCDIFHKQVEWENNLSQTLTFERLWAGGFVRSVTVAAAAAVLVFAACATSGTPHPSNSEVRHKEAHHDYDPTVPGPNQVVIYQFIFKPKVLTVSAGTTVSWVNRDIAAHTTTRNGGDDQFESGDMRLGRVFTHTFETPGTYAYICFYHPGMKATVIVTPAHSASGAGGSTGAGQTASAPHTP